MDVEQVAVGHDRSGRHDILRYAASFQCGLIGGEGTADVRGHRRRRTGRQGACLLTDRGCVHRHERLRQLDWIDHSRKRSRFWIVNSKIGRIVR